MKTNRIAVLLIAFASCVASRAQNSTLVARLTKVATVDALDAVDAKPWHAVIEAEIFDAKGSNPTEGTIEVWQSGTDRRTLYTFGSTTMTEIVKGKAVYRTTQDPLFPRFAPFLMARVLHAGPVTRQIQQMNPVLEKRTVDGQKLDCITTKPPANAISYSAPDYCLDAQDGLRVLLSYQQTVLLDAPEEFLTHAVSRHISITNSNVPTATAKITKLEVYEPEADQFAPSVDMPLFVPRARISGGVMAGLNVEKVMPTFPAGVSRKGSVILHVLVGTDGHVMSVDVVSAPDAAAGAACVDAIKQWTYKPYLLNGDPTQVETTITVNIQ
jgi:TonB family protein